VRSGIPPDALAAGLVLFRRSGKYLQGADLTMFNVDVICSVAHTTPGDYAVPCRRHKYFPRRFDK
jgi:hypothetical protein